MVKKELILIDLATSKMSESPEVLENALTRGPPPEVIAEMLAYFLYLLASIINNEYFEAVARRHAVSTRELPWHALLISIGVPQRLTVLCRGSLSALLVLRLICFKRERAVKRALKHATCVMSRRHFVGLKDSIPTCISELREHSDSVYSVAFHPSAPYLATGSGDKTAKVWLLNANCSAATCVSTLEGHGGGVFTVAFHPSAPYLATGSFDNTAKLWLLHPDCSAATCVCTLEKHSGTVQSVAFHSSGKILATCSEHIAKLWRLNPDCSAVTCVCTLEEHIDTIYSFEFHPSAPYIVTGSRDGTAKLWLLNADCSAATCVSTLEGHNSCVYSVAFHPSAPYLATGSEDGTAKLWR